MRVFIVNSHPHDALGGSEIQCDLFASHLEERGHEVVYGVVDPGQSEYDVNYETVSLAPPFLRSFEEALEDHQPDVLYWRNNQKWFFPSAVAAKIKGIPIVFAVSHVSDVTKTVWTGDSLLPARTNQGGIGDLVVDAGKIGLWLAKSLWNWNGFHLVDALTANNADHLDRAPVDRQIHVPNAAVTGVRPFSWDRPYLAWASTVKPAKNPEALVELARRMEDVDIDIVMAGRITDPAYEYIADGDTPSNLHHVGELTPQGVNGLLGEAELFLHTCDAEGFSNVLIQAWMQGTPTVSLYFDPEGVIEDMNLGHLSGSMNQFERDVRNLLSEPKKIEKIGQNARLLAEERFDPETVVDQLEGVLGEIVEDRAGEAEPPSAV